MRILIVEDDEISRFFMHKYLIKYGECILAKDGLEAIELFESSILNEEFIDLICLDIMLPKVDGLDVLNIIRKQESEISDSKKVRSTIIITSALNNRATVSKAYSLGCDAFLWKPIKTAAFDKVLQELLGE